MVFAPGFKSAMWIGLLIIVLLSGFGCCTPKRHFFAPVLLEYKIEYPDRARQLGVAGKVNLRVLVNEQGRVEQVRLLNSSNNALLDSAAVSIAYSFVFSPALMGDKPVKVWVNLPIEFKFEDLKPEIWLVEVKELQKAIAQKYQEDRVMELYRLYKKLIYSPRKTIELKVNDYIKLAVEEKAAQLWKGYWHLYPALPILFFDIIYRYPDSYARFLAEEEFQEFFEEEKKLIRNNLPVPLADSLINRFTRVWNDF